MKIVIEMSSTEIDGMADILSWIRPPHTSRGVFFLSRFARFFVLLIRRLWFRAAGLPNAFVLRDIWC